MVWMLVARERPGAGPLIAGAAEAGGAPDEDLKPLPAGRPAGFAGWIELFRDRSLILLTLSYGTVSYFQYLFFYWMSYYFEKVLALEEATSHLYEAVPPLAMAVGMAAGGWLSDQLEKAHGVRWGRRLVPIGGMIAGAVFLVVGVWTREPVWIVTWFSLALGAVGASEGPFWATAVELGGRRLGGSAAAILNTGGNGGGILAPIVTPWVGQRYGWGTAVAVASVICLVGAVLWLEIEPAREPRKPEALLDELEQV
jgi:MFS family permease